MGGGGGGEGGENDYEDSPLLGGEAGENTLSLRPDVAGPTEFSLMEKFFMATYLFFQGLLAGFSMALIYIVDQAASDYDLLVNYEPSANEIRRVMFIFGAISFVGALESFTDSWRHKRYVQAAGGVSEGGGSGSGRGGDKEHLLRTKTVSAGDDMITQAQLEKWVIYASYQEL